MGDRQASIEELLLRIKQRLQDLLGDSRVRLVLFGSRARGGHDESSDIDLAVIVRVLSRETKKRIFEEVASRIEAHLHGLGYR
jgi:predicted nucleotidyltransferase